MGVLRGIRVIDFGQYIAGPLAAGLLADYGAEVIRVDPPGGPVWSTPANATWNRGKRCLALDLKKAEDNSIAHQLIAQADVVIENFRPGVMTRLGLGAEDMLAANPRLIYCSLPGFAADDPRAVLPAWEGVIAAATNTYRSAPGSQDTQPVFTSLPIASNFAAFLATTAIIASLIARERDGAGQRIEVPLFHAMYTAMGTFALLPPSQIPLDAPPRAFDPYGGGLYQCADGQWVLFSTFRYRFLEWFVREAQVETLREEGLLDPQWSLATSDRLRARLKEIFATRPAHEWEELGNRAGVPMSRVRTPQEWLETEHAQTSGAIISLEDDEYGFMRLPGSPIRLAATPARPQARFPRATDRAALLAELQKERPGQPFPTGKPHLRAPLAGIRVLDLTQMWAGPAAARLLAECGAEVIKITDPDDAHFTERFHMDVNRGKRTILVNLKTSEGLDIFTRLARGADVVLHNFASGAVERLGIGYEALRRLRPDIIFASISACGSNGPWQARRGYEPHGSAITGLMNPDLPIPPPIPLNDWGTGVLGALAVLLSLFHRLRTGEGQEVEASLTHTATWHQTPYLYHYKGAPGNASGREQTLGWGPLQRLYQASDAWLFLGATQRDLPRLATLPELAGISACREEELDAFLNQRLLRDTARSWVERLQCIGIGAQTLQTTADMQRDPWALAQGLVLTREHQGVGAWTTIGPTCTLSRTPLQPGQPSPPLGADLPAILEELGLSDQLDRLLNQRAVRLSYARQRPV